MDIHDVGHGSELANVFEGPPSPDAILHRDEEGEPDADEDDILDPGLDGLEDREGVVDYPGAEDEAALASVGVRVTSFRGDGAWMLGGSLVFSLTPRTAVGGAGWMLTAPALIDATETGSESDLIVGYGGVVIHHRFSAPGSSGLGLRLLLGAGNAKVRLPVSGTEIAADNFGIVEPELVGALAIGPHAELRAQVGYRLAYGVEDLPQVTSRSLRGATFTLVFPSVGSRRGGATPQQARRVRAPRPTPPRSQACPRP
jgi:hypothetical protein